MPAADNCGSCRWGRPTGGCHIRTKGDPHSHYLAGAPPDFESIPIILCNRMPQSVENRADYCCGEWTPRGSAA